MIRKVFQPLALVACLLMLVAIFDRMPASAGTSDAASGPAASVAGTWLSGKQKVAIELYPCGGRLCGKIAWLADHHWSDGSPKLDERNPDPDLRGRPWCGIEVISGLKNAGGKWEDGNFYFPKDGTTYDLELAPRDDGTLKIRAYLGMKLLGKTEIWTRYDGTPSCAAEGTAS